MAPRRLSDSSEGRPPKRQRVTPLALAIPANVMLDHGGMDPLDYLVWLAALNHDNASFLVVRALAGTGKTDMLVRYVARLPRARTAVLLLSFTRAAIRVANDRMGVNIHTQTFDSLFYHVGTKCAGAAPDLDFEQYRELASGVACHVLSNYTAKSVRMSEINDVLVDESQDSPPGAAEFLELLRRMGKTVVIVGDRHQSIFEFQGTTSLFDAIPPERTLSFTLRKTRRCRAGVVDYINRRFPHLGGMEAAAPRTDECEAVTRIVYQTRYNARLGRAYAELLFSLDLHMTFDAAEGESLEKFEAAVREWARDTYRLTEEGAAIAIEDRRSFVQRLDTPTTLHFATVFRYKGDEADVTLLDADIRLEHAPPEDNNLCYVAVTRARWGVFDLSVPGAYYGCLRARDLARACLAEARVGSRARAASVAAGSLLTQVALNTTLPAWDESGETPVESYPHFPALTLLCWDMERRAPPGVTIEQPPLLSGVDPANDSLYRDKVAAGLVPWDMHARIRARLVRLKWAALVGRVAARRNLMRVARRGAMAAGSLLLFSRTRRLPVLLNDEEDPDALASFPLDTHPGILGTPEAWAAVVFKSSVKSGNLRVRHTIEICVADREGLLHTIIPRFGRKLESVHSVHAHLAGLAQVINTELPVAHMRLTVYHNGTMHPMALPSGPDDPAIDIEAVNAAVGADVCPVYYREAEFELKESY